MTEKITLITPTGNRPEAFALLESHMGNQVFRDTYTFEWLVIDDGTPETKVTRGQKYFRGPKEWQEGINTQRLNLDAVLPHVTGDYVFIIEDDDYYAPKYLQTLVDILQQVSVVGLVKAKYYNVSVPGAVILQNHSHAALSQTAFKKNILPLFEKAVNSGEYYIDAEFWDSVIKKNISHVFLGNTTLSVGIKGMPGREGLGAGHTVRGYAIDRDGSKLNEWLGSEASLFYKPFLKEIKNELLPEQTKKREVQPRLPASQPGSTAANRVSQGGIPITGIPAARDPQAVQRNVPVLDKLGASEPMGNQGNMSGRQVSSPSFGAGKR